MSSAIDRDFARIRDSLKRLTGELGGNRAIRQDDFKSVGTITLNADSIGFASLTADQKALALAQDIKSLRDAILAIAGASGATR